VPKPRLALAPLAVVAPVPPTAMARVVIPVSVEPESVTPLMVPPVMATALAFCVEILPSPSPARAPGWSVPPVPPDDTASGVLSPEILPPMMLMPVQSLLRKQKQLSIQCLWKTL
jgi:hypothetical protein